MTDPSPTAELVARLRSVTVTVIDMRVLQVQALCFEAAAALTFQAAEIARLREALEEIIMLLRATDALQADGFADQAVRRARAALGCWDGRNLWSPSAYPERKES